MLALEIGCKAEATDLIKQIPTCCRGMQSIRFCYIALDRPDRSRQTTFIKDQAQKIQDDPTGQEGCSSIVIE
jgi:hypothetical protein